MDQFFSEQRSIGISAGRAIQLELDFPAAIYHRIPFGEMLTIGLFEGWIRCRVCRRGGRVEVESPANGAVGGEQVGIRRQESRTATSVGLSRRESEQLYKAWTWNLHILHSTPLFPDPLFLSRSWSQKCIRSSLPLKSS
jgi:hypothetical protein